MTLSQQLARFAKEAFVNGVPADVAQSAKERLLDVVGLCLGATKLDTSTMAYQFALAQGTGAGTAIGYGRGLTPGQSAFVNGVLAHSLDFDDTHLPSVLHPSASIVPAALAAAEASGASGEQLVRAIAVGIEVVVRTGMAGYDRELGNSVFFEHGQHATSICGALGSAVTATLLLGGEEDAIVHALGLAASMASGVIEANRTGGTVKRLHCGWAAQSGVNAAQLVQLGFTGPPTALEGRFGFYQAFLHGKFDETAITDGLGSQWSVPGIFFKPYPSNHFTHAIIDAGLEFRSRGRTPEQIASITIAVPSAVIRTIGQPIDEKRRPQTGYQAQFSGPYAFAAGLLGGDGLGVTREDFTDELATDPRRRALMAKTDLIGDAECDAIFPHQFPARVTVKTVQGDSETVFIESNRGGPKRPLSQAELLTKFTTNALARVSSERANRIGALCLAIDQETSVSQLTELTVPESE